MREDKTFNPRTRDGLRPQQLASESLEVQLGRVLVELPDRRFGVRGGGRDKIRQGELSVADRLGYVSLVRKPASCPSPTDAGHLGLPDPPDLCPFTRRTACLAV